MKGAREDGNYCLSVMAGVYVLVGAGGRANLGTLGIVILVYIDDFYETSLLSILIGVLVGFYDSKEADSIYGLD